jgi:hypothetical protein
MSSWLAKLLLAPDGSTRLLIEGPEGDQLKARMPRPNHPRALLTTLEGAALWAGTPLCAAISAEGRFDPSLADVLFGAEWPAESALVRFVAAVPRARGRRTRISGVGDFRQLHLLVPEGA